jgi:CelD/BcsL family acetyltransferase involved in cellulose biosynthesis
VGLAGAEGVDVWLAAHAGAPVAGLLNLRAGGQVMNWGNVSLQDAWNLAPNNLLHWRAIAAACADAAGPRLYNFGSSAGLPNVHTFKRAFGAVDRTYVRWETGIAVGRLMRGRRSTG